MAISKSRSMNTIVVSIARADSATEKCVLPKDAYIAAVRILQDVDAVTAAGSFIMGKAGDTNALIEAFSMATTKVGLVNPGVSAGVLIGTKLTADTPITSTYTAGSSTAGGTGQVIIEYFMCGPGEAGLDTV